MAISATALKYASDHMDIKSNDKWLIAGAKLAGGPISKTTVAAFAALEFVARSAILILAGLPYYLNFISSKTFTDISAKTMSAFKTIGGAIAALATIRATEKKENSLLPSKTKLYSTMSWLKERVSGIGTKMINNPYPTAAVATAVVIGAIALYYNYPTAPQNEMCHPYSMCDRISLNPDQSSFLPISKWRLNQFIQKFEKEAPTLQHLQSTPLGNSLAEMNDRARETFPIMCAYEFGCRAARAILDSPIATELPSTYKIGLHGMTYLARGINLLMGESFGNVGEPLRMCMLEYEWV